MASPRLPRAPRRPPSSLPPQSDAATIAAVLATPCQNTELTPEAANLALVRAAVLCLINHKRAENGESPLALEPGARTGAPKATATN